MIKQIALLKAKAGLPREAFIRRYENGHVPLITSLIPFFTAYRRNYVTADGMISVDHVGPAGAKPVFDVITELWYEDQAALQRLVQAAAREDTGKRIAEDEEELFDRARMIIFTADEFVTPPERLAPRPSGREGRPAVKMMCLLKKRQGMSREAFIDYYETGHSVLAVDLLRKDGHPLFAEYRRSFPVEAMKMPHIPGPPPAIGFDGLTEICFWTEVDYRAFQDLCGQPDIGEALAADESKLFDRGAITMFLAEEHGSRLP